MRGPLQRRERTPSRCSASSRVISTSPLQWTRVPMDDTRRIVQAHCDEGTLDHRIPAARLSAAEWAANYAPSTLFLAASPRRAIPSRPRRLPTRRRRHHHHPDARASLGALGDACDALDALAKFGLRRRPAHRARADARILRRRRRTISRPPRRAAVVTEPGTDGDGTQLSHQIPAPRPPAQEPPRRGGRGRASPEVPARPEKEDVRRVPKDATWSQSMSAARRIDRGGAVDQARRRRRGRRLALGRDRVRRAAQDPWAAAQRAADAAAAAAEQRFCSTRSRRWWSRCERREGRRRRRRFFRRRRARRARPRLARLRPHRRRRRRRSPRARPASSAHRRRRQRHSARRRECSGGGGGRGGRRRRRSRTALVLRRQRGGSFVLKTAALAALLVKLAIPLPCDPGTGTRRRRCWRRGAAARRLFFESVVVDLADQQAIDAATSSYQAHLDACAAALAAAEDHAGGRRSPSWSWTSLGRTPIRRRARRWRRRRSRRFSAAPHASASRRTATAAFALGDRRLNVGAMATAADGRTPCSCGSRRRQLCAARRRPAGCRRRSRARARELLPTEAQVGGDLAREMEALEGALVERARAGEGGGGGGARRAGPPKRRRGPKSGRPASLGAPRAWLGATAAAR